MSKRESKAKHTRAPVRTTPPGEPPYLVGLRALPERMPPDDRFPFSLPFVRELDLTFRRAVTFFVGENGSGKSTLLEAIAALCRLPVSGGARTDLSAGHGPEDDSLLSRTLRPSFRNRPNDGYFLRAEFHAHFASLLDARARDPDFGGDPYFSYGGKSLHERSHGEAFLAIIQHRLESGMFLFDEPESALSPQRQLVLLAEMWRMVAEGCSQFIVATHSPILMTYPGAEILLFDEGKVRSVAIEETAHYQITRGILQNPESYWRHLRGEESK